MPPPTVSPSAQTCPAATPDLTAPPAGAAKSPTPEEVLTRLAVLRKRHPQLVSLQTLGHSGEGRPIMAADVTDTNVAAADKQHVLIVAGQHGNEESARLVALRLIDHLVSPSGRALLRRQRIVVVPNVNPDGAERNIYTTPAGIKPNLDHAPAGPTTPEAKAVEDIAYALEPEVFVDVHARGHAGWSHDMVLYPAAREYTEDENLLRELAAAMVAEGEKSRIPHLTHPLTWPGWGSADPNQPSTTCFAYRQFKSMVFLTESAEHDEVCYPERMRVLAGVNRLKALLAVGHRRYPKLAHSGYPCSLVTGMFNLGIVAVGKTAAQRRRSRVDLWRNAGGFEAMKYELPERPEQKTVTLTYTGPAIATGMGVQTRTAGRVFLTEVRFDGRKLKPIGDGPETGHHSWHDRYTTFAVAAVDRLEPGQHEVTFSFR